MSRLRESLDGYGVRVANSAAEFDEAMQVRRAVYVEELGWRSEEDLIDPLDSRAVHFTGRADGHVVCAARIVPDSSVFEGESCFDIKDIRSQGGVCEIGRLCVLPTHRKSLAAVALFRAFYRYALAQDIRFFFVAGPKNMDALYRSLGFSVIGGPKHYGPCRVDGMAYLLDLDAALDDWRARRPRMLEAFLCPIDGIG